MTRPTRPAMTGYRQSRDLAGRPLQPLLPLKARGALAKKGGDALPGVSGAKDGGEGLLLGLDPLIEIAGAGDALDLLHRHRRLSGELARPRQSGVEQFVVVEHAVDESVLVGLLGEDGIAGEVHLQCLVGADEPRQPLGSAEAGDDPELDLGLAEERGARGKA